MPETRSTGGAKQFQYKKEDLERIRSTDTQSTKAFKESLRKWNESKIKEKELEKLVQEQRKRLLWIAIVLVLLALALLLVWFL